MTFWMITVGMMAGVTALLVLALVRSKAGAEPAAAYDLRVYRDQLKEVERDAARGVIAPEEAARLKAEVSRRILTADTKLTEAGAGMAAPKGATRAMAAVLVCTILGGTGWLYWTNGAPGYGDLPLKTRIALAQERRATRPAQAEAEARLPNQTDLRPDPQYVDLVEKLRVAVQERPDDIQGQLLLVRNEAVLGNFARAHAAQARVLSIKGADAEASDYADYADLLILAAGGYVSPEAENALRAALTRDAENGAAQYYWGLMLEQNDRPDRTFQIWDRLLRTSPADAPWVVPIRGQIEQIAIRAGVEYTLPEIADDSGALRGPTADDLAAADDMSASERDDMIRTMVANLSERLATQGGSAPEWARLIGAYGVLGDLDQAGAIWNEAQGVFATRPEDLATVRAAAVQAGVAQ